MNSPILKFLENKEYEKAFELIVHNYSQALVGFAFRYGFNQEEAEDIAQETLVRVFKNIARYEPRASLASWLFRIETNLCLDRKRYQKRHPGVSLEELTAIPQQGPVEGASLLGRAIQEALNSLPERQRAAILLTRYEGMSYSEAARSLDVSEGALKQLIFRGRSILQEKLRDYI